MTDLLVNGPLYIAVIGAGYVSDPAIDQTAEAVGAEIAGRGHILICGGLGGVMQSAARGVKKNGGVSIGILPQDTRKSANPFLTYSIPTGFGHGRNFLIALSADGVIAIAGRSGTLTEIGFSLKLEKPLVVMETAGDGFFNKLGLPVKFANDPKEAVEAIEKLAGKES